MQVRAHASEFPRTARDFRICPRFNVAVVTTHGDPIGESCFGWLQELFAPQRDYYTLSRRRAFVEVKRSVRVRVPASKRTNAINKWMIFLFFFIQ